MSKLRPMPTQTITARLSEALRPFAHGPRDEITSQQMGEAINAMSAFDADQAAGTLPEQKLDAANADAERLADELGRVQDLVGDADFDLIGVVLAAHDERTKGEQT